ncbi:Dual specificity protein phosphatase cdc14a [Physocladia obscura]|uniref:protein-tyrosine-phosphatase n=1 Tax=Physocladia obscura TaxID=109957 RepID=A0AAD5SX07_9FUNG|nr:Dual specificity protein phosphatase cdc14a [Physocladia obscura]
MLVQKKKPEEAFHPLATVNPPFVPYRDAGYGAATYHITILDCLNGLYKALNIGLLHIENLNAVEYEFYEKVEHGDLNWVTDKFIAMACPKDDPSQSLLPNFGYSSNFGFSANPVGKMKYAPAYKMDDLIKLLKERGTTTCVRLNNKTYDRQKICDSGINHVEIYFPDGTTPPDGVLKRFLDLCESTPGVIAVHCKAGLGRTGTLIACYLIKHYKFSASEVIGLLRVLRPGSVVGPQQNYLQRYDVNFSMQAKLWKMHPSITLPPEISMLRAPTFPTSQRYPVSDVILQPRISLEQINAAVAKFSSSISDNMIVDEEELALEAELNSISMEDGGKYENNPVTLAAAALNMTTMDSETLELAEGGGGIYSGYAVPVQPRKQISAARREFVGGSVPSSGLTKRPHAASNQSSKASEYLMAHPHTQSSSSSSATPSKNFSYTSASSSRPQTQSSSSSPMTQAFQNQEQEDVNLFTSSQGTQTRYNLRTSTAVGGGSRSKSSSKHHPRAAMRAETTGVEAMMVSGKNVERLKTPGSSVFDESQIQQSQQLEQKLIGGRK